MSLECGVKDEKQWKRKGGKLSGKWYNAGMEKKLIYSVEDDDSIRELIAYALKSEGYEVRSFADAEGMLKAAAAALPELILLDIMLPGLNGIEALKILRERYKSAGVKVILLTAKASEINKVTGLDAGADDYITKPFSVLELTARIRANLRKTAAGLDGNEIKIGAITLNQSGRTAAVEGKAVNLTAKEFELLRYLMLNAGAVVGRDRLLKDIWGYEYFGESRTVDNHIKNLREKLGEGGGLIEAVRGAGYILKEK